MVLPTQRPGEEGDFKASVRGFQMWHLASGQERSSSQVVCNIHTVTAQPVIEAVLRHWCDVELMERAQSSETTTVAPQ